MKEKLLDYSRQYHRLMSDSDYATSVAMPGDAYFIEGGSILAIPRDDGDCRYPYGSDGFNYWTYASGYIHCNEGLFSPFLRSTEGEEPKIAFFAKVDDQVISLLSVPVLVGGEDVVRYTIFTSTATYFITEYKGILFGIRTFVSGDKEIYFTIEIVNNSGLKPQIELMDYFNPFIKKALVGNSTDRWFRKVDYIENQALGSFVIEVYEERDRLGMATNYGMLRRCTKHFDAIKSQSVTTSRYDFVGGSRSSLHSAASFTKERFDKEQTTTSFTETSICGDKWQIVLGDVYRYDSCFSYGFEEEDKDRVLSSELQGGNVDQLLHDLEVEEEKSSEGMYMSFAEANDTLGIKADVMNPFIQHLKKQVEFCSVIKGYIQLSHFSLIGVRDVYQALEGLVFYEPELAREKLIEGMNFLSPEGRFPRQYSLAENEGSSPAMDLRPFIDQGVWVISTLATYLRVTKDYSILEASCGYYDFIDEHKHIAVKSDLEDRVIDHLIKVMDYLLANRDHDYTKCVLALYGDWNDALDGLGRSNKEDQAYGTGVSVMASLQVYQNIDEMIELLSHVEIENKERLIASYKEAKESLYEGLVTHALTDNRILHGWGDEKSYLVGSDNDPDGLARDGLTSNAFWILSGLLGQMSDVEQVRVKSIILDSYKRLDSKYGLKTFEPHFEKGTYGVGRIPNLPKGTAENGATYIHASMFGVMSLFAIGEGQLAWEELAKLLPFTHKTISVSPYVVPNSYGDNEVLGIDGESMNDWQTGSSNVLLKLLIRYIFGFEPTKDGIKIQPSAYQPFGEMTFTISYLGKEITIKITKGQSDSRVYRLNGIQLQTQHDSVMNMDVACIKDQHLLALEEAITIEVEL